MLKFTKPLLFCLLFAHALFADDARVLDSPAERRETDQRFAAFNQGVRALVEGELGTWDAPAVRDDLPIDVGAEDASQKREFGWRLALGHDVYVANCERCHGEHGDGSGVESEEMVPPPRDFRTSVFKWKSTFGIASNNDLRRTVTRGLPGTAMPGFAEIGEQELAAVVDFVRWIAMTGMVQSEVGVTPQEIAEMRAMGESEDSLREFLVFVSESDDLQDDVAEAVQRALSKHSKAVAEEEVLTLEHPRNPDSPESRERGRDLFIKGPGSRPLCTACHGESGLGNGEFTKIQLEGMPGPGLYDMWGSPIRPANLTMRKYRGGDRPEDIYTRIAVGIPGTPMAEFRRLFTEEQIWDLVNYVLSLREE